MFNELNKYTKTVKDGIDTENMDYIGLKDCCGKTLTVDGFFFTDGNYGKQVVVVANGYLINMPKRAVEQFEEIATNKKMLDAVLDGNLVITEIKMKATKNGTTAIYTLQDK